MKLLEVDGDKLNLIFGDNGYVSTCTLLMTPGLQESPYGQRLEQFMGRQILQAAKGRGTSLYGVCEELEKGKIITVA